MNTVYINCANENNLNENLKLIANKLQAGSVGIFPTDTVYGIGCNALNDVAINNLFQLKDRDYSKPINILVPNVEMLKDLVDNISEEEQKLIDKFWPGALTIIFNKKHTVSNLLTANLNTVGIRMPNNKIALDLLNLANIPLATTSANISGENAGIKVSDFYNTFNGKIDFIIDTGTSNIKKASTIVQIVNGNPIILREGSISEKQIIDALK